MVKQTPKIRKDVERLAKFLNYMVGRKPDEFGLVPDEEGFLKMRQVLKAVCEEPGWRHIRQSHIDEVVASAPEAGVEVTDDRIRAVDRGHLPPRAAGGALPKLLYTCVRRRAYPYVSQWGVSPVGHSEVICATETTMAERIGRRIDREAVLLTVLVKACEEAGVLFFQVGDGLFATSKIPKGCFTGPPLPKEPPAEKPKSTPVEPRTPGSYLVDLGDLEEEGPGGRRKSRTRGGPEAVKGRKPRDRRQRETPPWRR